MNDPWHEKFDARVARALVENGLRALRAAKALLSTSPIKQHALFCNALDQPIMVIEQIYKGLKEKRNG